MRAGLLKTQIELIPPGGAFDEWGKETDGQSIKVAAGAESIKAVDRVSTNAVLSVAECVYRIRYMAEITTKWKVKIDGVTYGVVGFENDARHTWTRLFLKSR